MLLSLFFCRVKTQFQIVDPQLEKAQAHVMAVRAGKISSLKMKKKPTKLSTGYIVPGSSTEPATQARVHGLFPTFLLYIYIYMSV